MIADWQEGNPAAGNSIPANERQRIEDYCQRQIQHEWRTHRQRLGGDDSPVDRSNVWLTVRMDAAAGPASADQHGGVPVAGTRAGH
jgi:hypothetical protein